jgi:predicted ArsR family transcriptional regulator
MNRLPDQDLDRQLEMLSALVEPSRRALYEFVVSRAPEEVTRDEAARAVGMPRALAAFHLDRLVDAGMLEPAYRRLSGRAGPGAGRPSKLYRPGTVPVSLSLPPQRYDLIAMITVEALSLHPGEVSLEQVCATAGAIGRALGLRARAMGDGEDGPALEALSRTLDGQGFAPAVDAEGALRLRNCPFSALTDRFRSTICAINLALHRGVLEGLGTPDLVAELAPGPDRCCVAIRVAG